ncbi:hypothetical protein MMC29_000800 [Sticta canariensis]|nr:hypothetical protein [Sticta canariensis]
MTVPIEESDPSALAPAESQVSEDDFVVISDGGREPESLVQASGSSVSEQENNSKVSGKAPAAESQVAEEDFVIVSDGRRKPKSPVQASGSSVSERENISKVSAPEEDFVIVSDEGRKPKPPVKASGSSVPEQENIPKVSGRVPAAFTSPLEERETPAFLREFLRPRIHEVYQHPAHRDAESLNMNTEPYDQIPTQASAELDFNPDYQTMLHYMLHKYQVEENSLLEIKKFFLNVGFTFPCLFILGVVGVLIRRSPWRPHRRDRLAKHCISKRLQVFDYILELYRKGKPEEEILELCFSDGHSILDYARMGHNDDDVFGVKVCAYRASHQFVRDLLFFAKIQRDS